MKNLINHFGVFCTGVLFIMSLTSSMSDADITTGNIEFTEYHDSTVIIDFDFVKEDEFCWKQTYGRGVGTVPTICPDGMENDAGLCYPLCKADYDGVGPVCWAECPEGFRDDGAFCAKPEAYGRPQYPWLIGDQVGSDKAMWQRCEEANGKNNCVKEGLIVYAKCKEGFYNAGCCVCSPECPDGWTDIGVSCTKPSYGRGVGQVPTICPDSKEYNAGLCYKLCKDGYVGVGPVCWEMTCPIVKGQQWSDCGAGCAKSTNACVSSVVDMATAPLVAVLSIAGLVVTGGGSGAATASAGAATGGAQAAASGAKAISAFKNGKKILTYTTKAVKGAVSVSQQVIKNDLIAKAKEQLGGAPIPPNQMKGIEEYAAMAYDASRSYNFDWRDFAAIDPTGLANVAAAYANPLCRDIIDGVQSNTRSGSTNTTTTTTSTPKAIDGRNVQKVVFAGGQYVQVTGKTWHEKGTNGQTSFVFTEIGRDDWSVYLQDTKRGVYIMLNLWKKDISYKASASANYRKLYDISKSE